MGGGRWADSEFQAEGNEEEIGPGRSGASSSAGVVAESCTRRVGNWVGGQAAGLKANMATQVDHTRHGALKPLGLVCECRLVWSTPYPV